MQKIDMMYAYAKGLSEFYDENDVLWFTIGHIEGVLRRDGSDSQKVSEIINIVAHMDERLNQIKTSKKTG